MIYKQDTSCNKWAFENIPEFPFGEMRGGLVNTGAFLGSDESEGASFAHSFINVTRQEFLDYIDILKGFDFETVFENEIDGNLFRQFRCPEGLIYTSFFENDKTVRIILDRCPCATPAEFSKTEYTPLSADTLLVQYSLHYSHMIRGISSDCGMNYILRLKDNSVVIIDGGEKEQCNENVMEDYFNLLHEITGTKAGEKITIALWICTHPHDDHCDFFSRLLKKFEGKIEVERVSFNFPAAFNVRHSETIPLMKERIKQYAPSALFLKMHSGQVFTLADTAFTCLYANEDGILLNGGKEFAGTNDYSLIFMVRSEDDKILFLADCGDINASFLLRNYDKEFEYIDFLQAAHHGINELPTLYEKLETRELLLPQCRMNMETRFKTVYDIFRWNYSEKKIHFAGDNTSLYFLKDGDFTVRHLPHTGGIYDGSEL